MPDVVEPGTRLVHRYRLEEHLGGLEDALGSGDGTAFWRAHDELLDRPVGVTLLAEGDPHAEDVLRAARLAAAVSDSRFLRVLDASKVDGVVYVVSEWVSGTNLADLLEDGPLPAPEAHSLVAEVAAAMASAHGQGLAHLCLQPEHVLRTTHGQVKVAGLGVDAAARGIRPGSDAGHRDARGVAAVLYAALTARWPGDVRTRLADAPRDGASLCSPRQVRAGVPDDLDDVVCRALDVPDRHHNGAPLHSPADLAKALSAAHVTSRIPVIGSAGPSPRETAPSPAQHVSPYDDQGPLPRPRAARLAWAAAATVLVVGLVLFGGQLLSTSLTVGDPGEEPSGNPTSEETQQPRRGPLNIASATTLDPPPDGNGEENSDRAGRAVDGDESSAWPTKTYNDPFGPSGLKEGVGLLLDLGEVRAVSRVEVTVQGGATDFELRVAEDAGDALVDYDLVGQASDVFPRAVIRSDGDVRARYLLLWLTALPAQDGGHRGEVAEVTVSG